MSTVAKVFLILAIVGVLLCGGVIAALVIGIPKLIDWGKEKLEEEMARDREWQAFAVMWKPPPLDAPAEKLFPAKVGEFTRISHDEQAAIPALNIALAGHHGVYSADNQTFDVYAWRASDLEREAIYKRVIEILKHSQGFTSHTQLNARLRYSSTDLGEHGASWGNGQWLFFARSLNMDDLEPVLRSYLETLSEKPALPGARKPSGSSPVTK